MGSCLALVDWGTELVTSHMGAAGLDQDAMEALRAQMDTAPGVQIPLQLSGITTLIGLILLAIAVPGAKVGPVAAAIGLPLGVFGNVLGFATGSVTVQAVSNLVLTAAMVTLAWRWASPRDSASEDAPHALNRRVRNGST